MKNWEWNVFDLLYNFIKIIILFGIVLASMDYLYYNFGDLFPIIFAWSVLIFSIIWLFKKGVEYGKKVKDDD